MLVFGLRPRDQEKVAEAHRRHNLALLVGDFDPLGEVDQLALDDGLSDQFGDAAKGRLVSGILVGTLLPGLISQDAVVVQMEIITRQGRLPLSTADDTRR